MARVMVGRPRTGDRIRLRRLKANRVGRCDPESAIRRQPMSRGRGTKWLNENLQPLERYLRSQAGRPWDDVYSEISRCLRPTNAVQQHVRDHLGDFVLLHTWIEHGEMLGQDRWGEIERLKDPVHYPSFYVCPRTGLLRERPRVRRARRTPPPDPDLRWDGPWRQLRRIEGVWYAFRLERVPEDRTARAFTRDRFLKRPLEELLRTITALEDAYGQRDVYAAEKRQLSKRALRKLGSLPCGRKKVWP